MSDLSYTQKINVNNVETIRNQIRLKQQNLPYYGTRQNIITDMDHFPYTRFFRGQYQESNPIVMEREAGVRIVNNQCYADKCSDKASTPPNLCWQMGCSVILPCKPEIPIPPKEDSWYLGDENCVVHYR